MLVIDKYAYTNALRDVDPYKKVLASTFFLILSLIIKNVYILTSIIIFMSLSLVVLAKIELRKYLRLLCIPLGFLFLSILVTLVSISTNKGNLLHSVEFLNLYIGVSSESIDTSIHILFRSISCLVCVYFCMLTTPFNQLIYIMKKIHLPNTFVELSMLTYRFIFIFLEEFTEIYKSQELRFGYTNIKNSYRSLGLLTNLLYNRLMQRYEDMCVSLDMKLYDGEFHIVEVRNV